VRRSRVRPLTARAPSIWSAVERRPAIDCHSGRFDSFWPGLRDATTGVNRSRDWAGKREAAQAIIDLADGLDDCPDRRPATADCRRCKTFAAAKRGAARLFAL